VNWTETKLFRLTFAQRIAESNVQTQRFAESEQKTLLHFLD